MGRSPAFGSRTTSRIALSTLSGKVTVGGSHPHRTLAWNRPSKAQRGLTDPTVFLNLSKFRQPFDTRHFSLSSNALCRKFVAGYCWSPGAGRIDPVLVELHCEMTREAGSSGGSVSVSRHPDTGSRVLYRIKVRGQDLQCAGHTPFGMLCRRVRT